MSFFPLICYALASRVGKKKLRAARNEEMCTCSSSEHCDKYYSFTASVVKHVWNCLQPSKPTHTINLIKSVKKVINMIASSHFEGCCFLWYYYIYICWVFGERKRCVWGKAMPQLLLRNRFLKHTSCFEIVSGVDHNSATYPSWDHQIVYAYQVFLEFMKLLEVLHLYHIAMELSHHLRNLSQSS